jgi:hypothetical protein
LISVRVTGACNGDGNSVKHFRDAKLSPIVREDWHSGHRRRHVIMTGYEAWVSIALLGLWSCVGVIYNNSRKTSKQMDEIVRLLEAIAGRK